MTMELNLKERFKIIGDYHTHTIYSRVGPYLHGKGRIIDNVAAAKFYKEYLVELARRFGSEQHITTELALIDILQDKRTISSRLCAMYDKGSNKIRS
jgi:hypothetical protein